MSVMTSSPAPASLPATNPLAAPSQLPFQLPPFAETTPEHVREALFAGMAEHRSEVAAIIADRAEPTFENTVVALERSGELLARAERVFYNLTSAVSSDRIREMEREISPLAAAHEDALRLDPALFARVDAVFAGRHDAGLDAEQLRLVERYHLDFVLSGAALD